METTQEKVRNTNIHKVYIYLTEREHDYLKKISSVRTESVSVIILDLVRKFIDGEILTNSISQFEPEYNVISPILKALIYGKLDENERLTPRHIKKAARLLNCEEEKIFDLLAKI